MIVMMIMQTIAIVLCTYVAFKLSNIKEKDALFLLFLNSLCAILNAGLLIKEIIEVLK